MNSLVFSFSAACFAAFANLFFRKSSSDTATTKGDPKAHLFFYYFSSLLLALAFSPEIWGVKINWMTLLVGGIVGFFSVLLLQLTTQALAVGPAGLTFAFQNASAVIPGTFLFFVFGTDFGFSFSYLQLAGILLVLTGLFLGAKSRQDNNLSSRWLKYAVGCFLVQCIALTCIQARCILFHCHEINGWPSLLAVNEIEDVWFMPAQFGVASLLQFFLFLREKRTPQARIIAYGCIGGLGNFICTALLLLATKMALPFEKAILFPVFAVAALVLCNIWARVLYKEKFDVRTNLLCSAGIFIGVWK